MSDAAKRAVRPEVLVFGDPSLRGEPLEILTPEGVPLVLRIAPAGDRASAFVIDMLVMLVVLMLTIFVGAWMAGGVGGWGLALVMLLFFVARTFYFTWFEIRRHGTTPGKRRLGLRVVDAHGGPLTAEAVIARNLTREVEVFLPLSILVAPTSTGLGGPGWLQLLALAWAFLFALFPLFNRRRMRAGDLIAGTLVVLEPRTTLLTDIGRALPSEEGSGGAYAFTETQLDAYGNYELQVLEDVLRRGRGAGGDPRTLEAVARKIVKKIRWSGEVAKPESFLKAFYAALRARLERRLLLGRAKADKHAK